jgi:hypothetical protein
MPLNPKCWICRKELNQPGALYFEPPRILQGLNDEVEESKKRHLCIDCHGWIDTIIRTRRN